MTSFKSIGKLSTRRVLGLILMSLLATAASSQAQTIIGNGLDPRLTTDGSPALVLFNTGQYGYNNSGTGLYNQYGGDTDLASYALTGPGKITGASIYAGKTNVDLSFLLLRSTGNGQYTVVDSFSVNNPTTTLGVNNYSFGSNYWTAQAGDILAFWGTGPSLYDTVDATTGQSYGSYDANNNKFNYNATEPLVGGNYALVGNLSDAGSYSQPNDGVYIQGAVRDYSVNFDLIATPEPSTWALLIMGGAGLFYFRRRSLNLGSW